MQFTHFSEKHKTKFHVPNKVVTSKELVLSSSGESGLIASLLVV